MFVPVVVLNKMDLVSDEQRRWVLGLIKRLNPDAIPIETQQSKVPVRPVTPHRFFT
jgi:G3E family GTPase